MGSAAFSESVGMRFAANEVVCHVLFVVIARC